MDAAHKTPTCSLFDRYDITKYVSVILVTLGIFTCTLASTQSGPAASADEDRSDTLGMSRFLVGIGMLAFALVMSSFLGLYQGDSVRNYRVRGLLCLCRTVVQAIWKGLARGHVLLRMHHTTPHMSLSHLVFSLLFSFLYLFFLSMTCLLFLSLPSLSMR